MGELLTLELEQKTAAVRELLAMMVRDHGRVVYANSLGIEAMVLTDIIWSHVPEIDIFTVDTGRLHEETYALLNRLQHRYGRKIRVVYPNAEALGDLVSTQGVNGFFESVEARLSCCSVRKIGPFKQAVAGYKAWVTGVRREQSSVRAQGLPLEWDHQHGLYKISPLLEWTEQDIWHYVRSRKLPYNSLHDQGYPSIGCAPCTRAVEPGEDHRAGRWWWEQTESRECGLHPRVRLPGVSAAVGA